MSDLHVWSLKPGIPLLAAHVSLDEGADAEAALDAATSYCRSAGIEWVPLSIRHPWGLILECNEPFCPAAPGFSTRCNGVIRPSRWWTDCSIAFFIVSKELCAVKNAIKTIHFWTMGVMLCLPGKAVPSCSIQCGSCCDHYNKSVTNLGML